MIKLLTILVLGYLCVRVLRLMGGIIRRGMPDIKAFYRQQRDNFFYEQEEDGREIRVDDIPSDRRDDGAGKQGEYVDYKEINKTA